MAADDNCRLGVELMTDVLDMLLWVFGTVGCAAIIIFGSISLALHMGWWSLLFIIPGTVVFGRIGIFMATYALLPESLKKQLKIHELWTNWSLS